MANPVGRPPKYDPDFHPQNFITLSKKGKHLFQIAAEWDISRETLYAWQRDHKEFSDSVKRGNQLCEAWYMAVGQAGMIGGKVDGKPINLGFYVWLTKNKFKWADRQEIKQEPTQTPDASKFIFIEPKE